MSGRDLKSEAMSLLAAEKGSLIYDKRNTCWCYSAYTSDGYLEAEGRTPESAVLAAIRPTRTPPYI